MSIPDFLPVLSKGDHKSPSEGACFMEYASFLAGEGVLRSPGVRAPSARRPGAVCQ